MFFRPTNRLFAIKLLGLFGSTKLNDADDGDKQINNVAKSGDLARPKNVVSKSDAARPSGLDRAIELSSKKLVGQLLVEGIPGLTICVSKQGEVVWRSSFGFCDVENQLECDPDARMRIASISKAMFAATLVGPMIEEDKDLLTTSVHKFLTEQEFPRKQYDGKQVDITIEQLLSHKAGIRSYDDHSDKTKLRPVGSKGSLKISQSDDQYERKEFFTRLTYRNAIDALEPFKDSPLVNEPGKYSYTTYGFTLLSAVFEQVYKQFWQRKGIPVQENTEQIEDYWVRVLQKNWSLQETSLDQDEPILPNRARHYLRSGVHGKLVNAPYTDLSVKWSGGGLVSTASNLVKFGNKLIDAYKGRDNALLKRETVEVLWKKTSDYYALGFEINPGTKHESVAVGHTGAAVGASSILIIYPESEVVVAILANLGNVNLRAAARYVADQFLDC